MATATYSFIPAQVIWYITDDCGIREATVRIVEIRILAGSQVNIYTIQYVGEETTVVVEGETNLFAVLETGGSPQGALDAYQTILEA